ncbi:hypothetical protein MNBD_GAMMA12-1678 [hydrothermal vent metagenome]|uniref:WGR domain-containing protein n=1 Tax=hydrothermal vent metagenome TaxID=652676 RepID=A0A3B0XXI9_9ZZZZ
MPRYEYDDGTSQKFWEINIINDTYEVCYGKIGTKGQISIKNFSSDQEAQLAADKITASKVKKGYGLVGKSSPSPSPVNPIDELVRSIQIDPDNIEAWQVYSDYLQTQNDPRGELIALGIAIEKSPRSKKGKEAKVRFNQIFEESKEAGLGVAAEYINDTKLFSITWKYGYLLNVRVAFHYDFVGPSTHKLLGALLKGTAGHFIQTISIGVTEGMEDADACFSDCTHAIVSGGRRVAVKKLTIGDFESDECEISCSTIGYCGKVYAVLPNLEQLIVHGGDIELGKIKHKNLKTLSICTGGLSATAVKAVAKADLPALEMLIVYFGAVFYGAEGEVGMLKPLFEGKGYPALKQLGLMNALFENEIVQALVKAPIVKQLISLDLSMGTMTDEGGQILIDNVDLFGHLDHINVSDNFLTEKITEKLEKVYPKKMTIGDQKAPNVYDGKVYTYVSVAE